MPRAIGRSLFFALAAFTVAAGWIAPAAAASATVHLPLAVYGLRSGATVTGSNPRFDLYVPDYRSARSLTARYALAFPSIVDGNGVVTVRVDGVPVGTSTVEAVRGGAIVSATFSHFEGKGRMLDVSIDAQLTVGGKKCREYDPKGLWMRILPASELAVDRNDAPPATVREFFEDYDGRYAVDVAPGAGEDVKRAAIGLAYWLHQIERWRHIDLAYLKKETAPGRTIVVGPGEGDLRVAGGKLYTTVHGIDVLRVRFVPKVSVEPQHGVAVIKGNRVKSPATLDALGIGTRTQRGTGDMSFPTGFSLGTFGGVPRGLHFHLDVAHGSYQAGDRAAVTVLLNGSAINGFQLSQNGGTQRYDVPIDEARLGPSNSLDVIVEFVPKGCAGASMTISLLGSSSLAWSGVNAYPPTIGEFFNEAAGHLGLAISDPKLDGNAFTLLDRIGSIDPNVTRITVAPYGGSAMSGVREAAYVSAPEAFQEIPISWNPQTGDLNLSNDKGQTVFAAKLGTVYG
ncbi:MAG: cellulose biosynthesis cyclic di-GMP-binding regulatory protein BcsB, partial [Candidatus Eremiobacteraeota bacterium]|nr:cellulose biosynthesis cyclic di-GMP-binding regulatory protein BcsB [Candidatus Eremiobacteraeota bacterium]